jgi:hypothetical protein
MAMINRSLLALLALLVAAPAARAAKCSDTSGFAAAQKAVEALCSCDALKHGKYVKCGKKVSKGNLSHGCRGLFTQRFLAQSTCGRTGFVVCCQTNKKGKDASKAVKAAKCHRPLCPTDPTSVGEGCTSSGACVTTTTTTTTTASTAPTTTTTTTSTTTTTCPESGCTHYLLDFTVTAPTGTCGTTKDGSNVLIKSLTCGGLNLGGGAGSVPEGPTPEGSVNRYRLDCAEPSCAVGPTTAAPAVNSAEPDCTDTGCNFGTPLPIPNGPTSTCVLNTYSAPAGGTLDRTTGATSLSVALSSDTYLTGVNYPSGLPCPRCIGGTCDVGARAGLGCLATNPDGLTRDCPPGGSDATFKCIAGSLTDSLCTDGSVHIGPIAVDLSPLTTGSASKSDANGLFCASLGQGTDLHGAPGCFGSADCRSISETGSPAGPLTPGVASPAILASVFCIAKTNDPTGVVDTTADLPGPGAVSLPGKMLLTQLP